MRTNLPTAITTIKEAATFLYQLWSNGESYHPEDDAHKVDFTKPVTDEEKDKLNNIMEAIYTLPGNVGTHPKLRFDPCMLLNILHNAGEGKNFDFAISKDDVLELIRPIDPTPDGHTTLLAAIGIFDIMCEDMGEDEDWIGITGDDYEIIKDDEQYKTFELWIHPSVTTSDNPVKHWVIADDGGKIVAIVNNSSDLYKAVEKAIKDEMTCIGEEREMEDVVTEKVGDELFISIAPVNSDDEEDVHEFMAYITNVYQ